MLEQLIGSKTRVKLLQLFFQFPHKSFYVREIARTTVSQLNAVRRELANLEKLGLIGESLNNSVEGAMAEIEFVRVNRSKYYKLRHDCLLTHELMALLSKAQILQERDMVEQIKAKAGKLKLLLLTGTITSSKDVGTDILLVGDVRPMVVAKLIVEFEKQQSKSIRYTIMTEKEFFERKEIGDRFLYGILESKYIAIVNEIL
jgi:predicted transcriptional regulator with HTH domain